MDNWKEIWQSQKQARRKEHQKLVRKLKTQPAKKINALGGDLHEDVFQQVDCLECANCCTSIPPIVTRTDVNRISKVLGLKPTEFADTYLRQDEDGDTVMRQSPCPFLLQDNTCLIYEDRPKACRQYPHTDHQQFAKELKLHATNARYCPAVFHILERLSASF
ncbi:MAG: YkgJ family cysteine cluster protein [Bacteroidota bacterium]